VALLHSLANIEQWAIDLSWDIICRFGSLEFPDKTKLPKEFFEDFIQVACDEAKVCSCYIYIVIYIFFSIKQVVLISSFYK
jgi:uncharacterized ferritin-like protein (DUF455 family)